MRTSLTAVLPLVLALSLAGCSEDDPDETDDSRGAPDPGPAFEIAATGGCDDAFFWAADAHGSQVIQVHVDQRDRPTKGPTSLEIALPDPTVTATLQSGEDLTGNQCNDLPTGEVSGEQEIVEGSGTMTLDPPSTDHSLVGGTLTMTGLVAEDGTALPDLTIETDTIGFYAG